MNYVIFITLKTQKCLYYDKIILWKKSKIKKENFTFDFVKISTGRNNFYFDKKLQKFLLNKLQGTKG